MPESMIQKAKFQIEPLTQNHLELVRFWRNQDSVRLNMEFQEVITAEMQLNWFRNLEQDSSRKYFVFSQNLIPIGLVHLAEIDFSTKSAQVGLFVGNEKFHGTGSAIPASLYIMNLAFGELGLETLFAKVKSSNQQAIQYNSFLGFQWIKKASELFEVYALTKDQFVKNQPRLEQIYRVDSIG